MRIWIFAVRLTLSCSAPVEARGLVGWPGSFKNSGFCKTYGCTSAKTVPSQGWGDPTTIYRLGKLPGATLHVHMTSENEIESAVLNFNGRVYTQLTANDSKAINAFLQVATGRKVAFSLAECRKSETPGRARPLFWSMMGPSTSTA